MTDPIRHTTCGTPTEPRWVLDDTGDDAIVCWCPRCDTALAFEEMTREMVTEDVPVAMLLQAPTLQKHRM